MENKELQKKLLEYAYSKYKNNAVSTFGLDEVFMDFKDYTQEILIKNLEFLNTEGLIHKNKSFYYKYSTEPMIDRTVVLKISPKGITEYEDSKKGNIEKTVQYIKKNDSWTVPTIISSALGVIAIIISSIALYVAIIYP